MKIRALFGAVIGAMLFSGTAFATTAAPPHAQSPLSFAGRQFFVSPSGTDSTTCGAGPMGAASNCRTPWGASAATSIGGTGTVLTGGDTVNVFGTTPTQTTLGSSGWTDYDMGTGHTWSRSGTNNSPTGYINYVCSVNHGCKMTITAATGGSGPCLSGNFLAFDGFEWDGGNIQGYKGYSPSNTNTYFTGAQMFCQGGGHHHMFVNDILHSSGGGVLSSIQGGGSVAGDYEYVYASELYDFSGVNGSQTSGYNNYEVIGLTPVAGNFWDNDPFHLQFIGNVIHDGGETVNITGGHTDGEGLIQDTFGHSPQYPYGQLIAYNSVYNVGGRGILIFAGSTINANTITNNTVYGADMDLGAAGQGLADNCSFHDTWQNNLSQTNTAGAAAGWHNAGCGTSNSTWHNNLTFNGTVGQASTSTDGSLSFTGNGNMLGVDPKFANVANKDFHPVTGSPVLGAGLTNTTSRIFPFVTPDGQTPSSPPNIGAFNVTGGGGPPPGLGPVSINAGGPAATPFIADTGFTPNPGTTANNNATGAVDTTLVTNPAPTAVYRTERWGNPFTYTVNGLKPSQAYAVNLEFTEDWQADINVGVGARVMNVSMNGTQVLTNFDIFAAAGAGHKAVRKSFIQAADTNGNIAITFTAVAGHTDANAKVDGISVLLLPTANLSANPTTINAGNSTTLTWSSANSTRCVGTNFSTGNAVSGTLVVSPTATTTYAITCDAGGVTTSATQMVTVNSTLSASLSANPTTILSGGSSTLTWSSNATTKCVGTNFSTGNATSGTASVSPTTNTTYSVACDSGGTPVNASTTVFVSSITASISANPSTILNGQTSTLTWSSNGTRCVGTNFSTGNAPSGTISVTPTVNTTYSIACDAGGATTPASTTVTVNPVTASLSASPSTIANNVTISNSTGASIGASRSTTNSVSVPAQSYFEVKLGSGISSGNTFVGLGNSSESLTNFPGVDLNGVGWEWNTGDIFINNTHSNTNFVTGVANDIVAFAVDFTNNKLWVRNVTQNTGWNNDVIANQNPGTNTGGYDISGLNAGPYFIMASVGAVNGENLTLNAGTTAFIGPFPTGFSAWGKTTTFDPSNTGSPAVLLTQSSTLTWSSNGSRCIGTGFSTGNAASGTQSVSPTVTTTYSVACDAGGAATMATTTVNVQATPSASIISNKTAVPSNAATISWSSVNAAACTGTNFSTGGATSGSVVVTPLATTTYTVTCDNSPPSTVQIIVPVLVCQAGPPFSCNWVADPPAPVPTAVFSNTLPSVSSGWGGYNIRIIIPKASLVPGPGGQIRAALQFASTATSGSTLDSVWIGTQASSGNPYNFAGDQVQLQFSGSNSVTLGPSLTVMSDWANFAYLGIGQNMIVAAHLTGSTSNVQVTTFGTGQEYYLGAADNGGTTAPSGTWTSDTEQILVTEIDTQ